jgi:hypothetical protein
MSTSPSRGATPRGLVAALLGLLALAAWLAPAAGAATVATGERQSCGIFSGAVRCWGQDTSGALGFVTDSHEVPYATLVGAPIRGATHVVATSTGGGGSGHVCAVANGAAWCWGPNGYGVAGTGTKEREIPIPVAVPALASGVTLIDKNASRSCAIVNGGAFCSGGSYLGDGTSKGSSVPVAVLGMGSGVTDIGTGWRSICVLKDGGVYCWGASIHGQLAGGGGKAPEAPVALPGAATAIDAGTDSACAVVGGGVWCWGSNGSGRLGVGDLAVDKSSVALNVAGLPAGSGVVDIAGNGSHYCVLKTDGAVLCWGDNFNGKVGNGTTTGNAPAPVAVQGLPGPASSISVSNSHSCAAVGKDFYCWGSNSGGQLGHGTIGGTSGTAVKVLLPPKATITRPAKPVKVSSSRKAALATILCPIGTGSCTTTLPKTVAVKLNGISYRLAIAPLATVAPGAQAEVVATLPGGLYEKLSGKTAKVTVRVVATNSGGKLTKTVTTTIKR